MISHNTHFNYDGIWSYDLDIINVNISGGLFEDTLVSNKRIIEDKIEGRDTPYFYNTLNDPLSFNLHLLFDDNISAYTIRKVLRWLDTDTYKPFYTLEEPDRWLYVMPVDDISLIYNGLKSGYLNLNMRANSSVVSTPYSLTDTYEIRNDDTIISIENTGDFDCYPLIYFTKIGDGDVSITNLSDGKEFKFVGLQDGERLYVDCHNKEIVSDFIRHRYNNFNGGYLRLVRGINQLKVVGNCDLQFEMEFKTY